MNILSKLGDVQFRQGVPGVDLIKTFPVIAKNCTATRRDLESDIIHFGSALYAHNIQHTAKALDIRSDHTDSYTASSIHIHRSHIRPKRVSQSQIIPAVSTSSDNCD